MLLRIRRTRLEAGQDLAEVATHVGIAAQALSRIEHGREVPWPAVRARLAAHYGVPADELFADIDAAQAHLRSIAGRGKS